jgi:hypothetical protein
LSIEDFIRINTDNELEKLNEEKNKQAVNKSRSASPVSSVGNSEANFSKRADRSIMSLLGNQLLMKQGTIKGRESMRVGKRRETQFYSLRNN